MDCLTPPVFFPFRSRPLKGGAGIAGKVRRFPFRDISGIAGKNQPPFSGTGLAQRAAATMIRRYLARGAVEPGRLAGLVQIALPGTSAEDAAELARTLMEVRA